MTEQGIADHLGTESSLSVTLRATGPCGSSDHHCAFSRGTDRPRKGGRPTPHAGRRPACPRGWAGAGPAGGWSVEGAPQGPQCTKTEGVRSQWDVL